jgi:glyoxylase-like metal-dependent hydrolase (beta-lactamase superfamily II)
MSRTSLPPQTGRRVAHEWFYTRELLPGVMLVGEPQHVNSWLVEGSERAVLLDTGLGIAPVRPVAEALTDRPVSVVNTHYHFDHVGGNHEFEEIAIHAIGAPLIEAAAPTDVLQSYATYAGQQLGALAAYQAIDQHYYWLMTADAEPRPFPPGFDAARWQIPASRATTVLADGDRIDLGGRTLTVLHTPGHSPDMISLLDERDGVLFAADGFNVGPVYCHFPDSDLDALAATAARYAEISGEVRAIVCHHFGRALAEPGLLVEYAADVERVRSGEVSLTRGEDILGDPYLEARFDHYAITLPDPDSPGRVLSAG